MISFKNTAIVYNRDVPESSIVAGKAAELFSAKLTTPDSLRDDAEFVVTVGGDGTILRAARYYAKKMFLFSVLIWADWDFLLRQILMNLNGPSKN